MPPELVLVAVDAGTTSVRALAIDAAGGVLDVAHRALTQSYPAPGLVEHDADEIVRLVDETLTELCVRLGPDRAPACVGITNQRETVVALDRHDGRVLAPAIVWQDRRTSEACAAIVARGEDVELRARTGLTADPYFSATKMQWLLERGVLDGATTPGLCTVDTLVAWHLSGGPAGGAYVTDASNASRTLLFDLDTARWSDALCARFDVPRATLAELRPSCGVLGEVTSVRALRGVPVAGILGDQQAALFGQRCTRPGMVKATFGTGAFLLANAGEVRPPSVDGLLTTVAWDLGDHGPRTFAVESAAFVAGAAIQWLHDELGLLAAPEDAGPLAGSVPDANGAVFVPALSGLGSPWWDAAARGTLVGLSRGVTSAHVVRAVVDALAFQGRAMLDAMRAAAAPLTELRIDGGAAAMALLCQSLADHARLTVRRPTSVEATAIGAALCAGVAVGACELAALEASWVQDAAFTPGDPTIPDLAYAAWLDAIGRARALGTP